MFFRGRGREVGRYHHLFFCIDTASPGKPLPIFTGSLPLVGGLAPDLIFIYAPTASYAKRRYIFKRYIHPPAVSKKRERVPWPSLDIEIRRKINFIHSSTNRTSSSSSSLIICSSEPEDQSVPPSSPHKWIEENGSLLLWEPTSIEFTTTRMLELSWLYLFLQQEERNQFSYAYSAFF